MNAQVGFHGLTAAALDALDREIVTCLLNSGGRLSVSAIARQINISRSGTSQRLQRLFESQIVAVGAFTNPVTHGYSRHASILIKVSGGARFVANEVSKITEAYYVALVTGRIDIAVEFIARDDRHFEEIIERIRTIDGVIETEVLPVLDLVKWNYSPEFPDSSSS